MDMDMTRGIISYVNAARRFALITPLGKSREHDVFAAEIWFWVARCRLPYVGQRVKFEVAHDASGILEAVKISKIATVMATDITGAAPAAVFGSAFAAAGDLHGTV